MENNLFKSLWFFIALTSTISVMIEFKSNFLPWFFASISSWTVVFLLNNFLKKNDKDE